MIVKKMISLKNIITILAAFAVLAAAVSAATGNTFIKNIVKSVVNQRRYDETAHEFKIDDFRIEGNTITFSGNGSEYHITAPTESGEQLKVIGSESTLFTLEQAGANNINIHDMNNGFNFNELLKEGVIYLDLGYISTIDFAVTSEGVKLIVQNTQLLDSVPHSQFSDTSLRRFYGFATGRGYIWINSLPILKDCLLIGKGAGNFPFCFTQNELVGILNTHGTYRIIVDKPHNWYLQIAVTCGIPALTAVLILLAYFVISGLRLFIKTPPESLKSEKDKRFLMFLFTGLCGFMITGLSNDSCVTVNPFFWFSFGIAFLRVSELRKGASE